MPVCPLPSSLASVSESSATHPPTPVSPAPPSPSQDFLESSVNASPDLPPKSRWPITNLFIRFLQLIHLQCVVDWLFGNERDTAIPQPGHNTSESEDLAERKGLDANPRQASRTFDDVCDDLLEILDGLEIARGEDSSDASLETKEPTASKVPASANSLSRYPFTEVCESPNLASNTPIKLSEPGAIKQEVIESLTALQQHIAPSNPLPENLEIQIKQTKTQEDIKKLCHEIEGWQYPLTRDKRAEAHRKGNLKEVEAELKPFTDRIDASLMELRLLSAAKEGVLHSVLSLHPDEQKLPQTIINEIYDCETIGDFNNLEDSIKAWQRWLSNGKTPADQDSFNQSASLTQELEKQVGFALTGLKTIIQPQEPPVIERTPPGSPFRRSVSLSPPLMDILSPQPDDKEEDPIDQMSKAEQKEQASKSNEDSKKEAPGESSLLSPLYMATLGSPMESISTRPSPLFPSVILNPEQTSFMEGVSLENSDPLTTFMEMPSPAICSSESSSSSSKVPTKHLTQKQLQQAALKADRGEEFITQHHSEHGCNPLLTSEIQMLQGLVPLLCTDHRPIGSTLSIARSVQKTVLEPIINPWMQTRGITYTRSLTSWLSALIQNTSPQERLNVFKHIETATSMSTIISILVTVAESAMGRALLLEMGLIGLLVKFDSAKQREELDPFFAKNPHIYGNLSAEKISQILFGKQYEFRAAITDAYRKVRAPLKELIRQQTDILVAHDALELYNNFEQRKKDTTKTIKEADEVLSSWISSKSDKAEAEGLKKNALQLQENTSKEFYNLVGEDAHTIVDLSHQRVRVSQEIHRQIQNTFSKQYFEGQDLTKILIPRLGIVIGLLLGVPYPQLRLSAAQQAILNQ